jgi:hypothetical protein
LYTGVWDEKLAVENGENVSEGAVLPDGASFAETRAAIRDVFGPIFEVLTAGEEVDPVGFRNCRVLVRILTGCMERWMEWAPGDYEAALAMLSEGSSTSSSLDSVEDTLSAVSAAVQQEDAHADDENEEMEAVGANDGEEEEEDQEAEEEEEEEQEEEELEWEERNGRFFCLICSGHAGVNARKTLNRHMRLKHGWAPA